MRKLLLLFFVLFSFGAAKAQTVYITKTGQKYHKAECGYLKNSAITLELNEALQNGYDACKICKPAAVRRNNQTNRLSSQSTSAQTRESSSVQCSGKTQKGTRCKRMIKNSSGRCYQHS